MKEKDPIKGDGLERTNEELFGSFEPGDASIGGEGYTHTWTSRLTCSDTSYDFQSDNDFDITELMP